MGKFLCRIQLLRRRAQGTWQRQTFAQTLKALHLVYKPPGQSKPLVPTQQQADALPTLRSQDSMMLGGRGSQGSKKARRNGVFFTNGHILQS
eukprot:1079506-Amphidinium_carterae.1